MECMDPARGDRRKVSEGVRYPFAVTSIGNTIYYTDWQRCGCLFYHKLVVVLTAFLPRCPGVYRIAMVRDQRHNSSFISQTSDRSRVA